MEVIRVVTGLLDENCYILKIDNNCLVVDPGDDYSKINADMIEELYNFDKNSLYYKICK